jgi:hypothetical protein
MNNIYDQLARTGLLPGELSTRVLAGRLPPLEELALPLVICSMDAEALIAADKYATLNERRIARQLLAVSFLAGLLLQGTGSEPQGVRIDTSLRLK